MDKEQDFQVFDNEIEPITSPLAFDHLGQFSCSKNCPNCPSSSGFFVEGVRSKGLSDKKSESQILIK
jgi:hypothetical protein